MTSGPARRLAVFSAVLTLCAAGGTAEAQDTSAPAESLFDEGRTLLGQGRYAEACPKFAESERLDPAVGTLLNLGDCYEKMGKIATAWAVFKEATAMAVRGKQAGREKIAAGRAAALEPKLPRLSIVAPNPIPGLEVRRDGVLLGPAEWSSASPSALAVDPGDHEVAVSAPGKKAWTTKVTLAADGQTRTVSIPALEDDELADRAPLSPKKDAAAAQSVLAVNTHDRNVQRGIAIAIGAVGAASMLAAIPFGARAVSLNDSAKSPSECPTNTTCTSQGQSDAQNAVSSGTISTILLAAGGAVVVGGVVLFFTAPQPKAEGRATGVVVTPLLGPGAIGLSGRF